MVWPFFKKPSIGMDFIAFYVGRSMIIKDLFSFILMSKVHLRENFLYFNRMEEFGRNEFRQA